MKFKTCALVIAGVLLAASCNRAPQTPATAPGPAPIQQVAGPYDPAAWGRLEFRITRVYIDQQLAEEFPGHRDGGAWMFMDCAAAAPGGDVPFVVGVMTEALPAGDQEGVALTRGRAVVRTRDRAATDAFLALFAESFHTGVPEPLAPKPVHPVVFSTEVLGTSLSRAAGGNGFTLGDDGPWTATKWSPATPHLHAEVFFNYSLATRQGEFSEKDFSQRDNLLAFWAHTLRDGPRGQRTTQEDPNVAATGPQLGPLTPVAGAEARHPFFVPGGRWLVYATAEEGAPAQLWTVDTANPQNRRKVAEFAHTIYQVQSADPDAMRLLVEEKTPDIAGALSSADPSRFWWIDALAGQARALDGPWNPRDIDCHPDAVSPDSHYLVLAENRTRADDKGGYTQLYLIDLQSVGASTVDVDQQWLQIIGWRGTGADLRLLVRTGLAFDPPEKRKACLIDPATGDWKDAGIVEANAASVLPSPDGKNLAVVVNKERLEIRPAAGGAARTLVFNKEDRPFVDEDCVDWLDDRYMSFFNPYPIVIDTVTMKMHYLLASDLVPEDVIFSPDFKTAAVVTEGGVQLGAVTGAEGP